MKECLCFVRATQKLITFTSSDGDEATKGVKFNHTKTRADKDRDGETILITKKIDFKSILNACLWTNSFSRSVSRHIVLGRRVDSANFIELNVDNKRGKIRL